MDIQKLIRDRIKKSGKVTVAEIVQKTGFSRAYVHRFFQELVESGTLARVGYANRAHYVFSDTKALEKARRGVLSIARTLENQDLEEDAVFDLILRDTGIFIGIAENVRHALDYAFTEMLNNAIEHSRSPKIKIDMQRDASSIRFDIIDWGIGIFENLIHTRHLQSTQEAIQDLLKGKQTTVPEAHTGEGIFFTRRIADIFIIRSSTKKLFFNNVKNDFTISTIKQIHGTRITFTIARNAKKELREIFKAYTTESFEFGVTEVVVRLYHAGGTNTFISRSQARRVLYGLEKFKKIILDFNGVVAIGQGFADEVFRIWHVHHPDKEIVVQNANQDIEFMIGRAKQEL